MWIFMEVIVDSLLNKATLLFCILTAIFFIGESRRKKQIKNVQNPYIIQEITIVSRLSTIFVMLITIVIFIFATNVTANRFARPSRVNVSPLALLNEYHIVHVEEALIQLNDNGIINMSGVETSRSSWRYNARWISGRSRFRVLFISAEPQGGFLSLRGNMLNRRLYEHIQYDNNTEAISQPSFMEVCSGGFYMPNNDRIILSNIRIGEYIISLRETRRWYDFRNDYSSQFIAVLVETLQDIVNAKEDN